MTNLEFTKEQKSLIWTTKLVHSKATEQEAQAFLNVCEEYGLNPLLGDITFQKFETKYGPRVSYLISRDALLKYAMRQDDFHNILSGVVKEGDHFEMDVVGGVPIHKFGAKRGKIVGAWSVVKTNSRGNTLVFADFPEYHSALSGKNPVWNSMPSAMIEKVAQSMALKRTFPLGVQFASDDEVGTINLDDLSTSEHTPAAEPTSKPDLRDELQNARVAKEKEKKPSKKQTAEPSKPAKVEEIKKQEVVVEAENPVAEEPVTESTETEKTVVVEEVLTEEKTTLEDKPQEETTEPVQEPVNADIPLNVYEFIDGVLGESGNKTKFLRVKYKDGQVEKEAFARGLEAISVFDEFHPGVMFTADLQEVNGFSFVMSAQAV